MKKFTVTYQNSTKMKKCNYFWENIQYYVSFSYLKYFFVETYHFCKRIIKWIPVLKKIGLHDYIDTHIVMRFQLQEMYNYYTNSKHITSTEYINKSKKVKTAINLLDIIIDNETKTLTIDTYIEKYGEMRHAFDTKSLKVLVFWGNSSYEDSQEITKQFREDRKKSIDRANKAKRIFWDYMKHNIYKLWD